MTNKLSILKSNFLNDYGESVYIKRYEDLLGTSLYWTSGDSFFRMDGDFSNTFKFATIKGNGEIRYSGCFKATPAEKAGIERHRYELLDSGYIPQVKSEVIADGNKTKNAAKNAVWWIKIFGPTDKPQFKDPGIRRDILEYYKTQPCAHCGCMENLECDHKNDLKESDPRILNKDTQTKEDFQSLCGTCNKYKRSCNSRRKKTGTRVPFSHIVKKYMHPSVMLWNDFSNIPDFTEGDETYNETDPNWWVGTYWGDVVAFRESIKKAIS